MKAVGWLMGIAASAVILELVFWSRHSKTPPPNYSRVATIAPVVGPGPMYTAYYYPDGRLWLLPKDGSMGFFYDGDMSKFKVIA
jgi:hypothetical protein